LTFKTKVLQRLLYQSMRLLEIVLMWVIQVSQTESSST